MIWIWKASGAIKKYNYPFLDLGLEPVFKPGMALTDVKTKFARGRKL